MPPPHMQRQQTRRRRTRLKRWFRQPSEAARLSLLSFAVLAFGATGFLYFELSGNPQLNWADACWYAIVTVTTVGYGDLSPVTAGGRYIVAIPLMFFGIGLLGYVLSLAAGALVQAKQRELKGLQEINFKNHLVLFNYPDLDKIVRLIDELRADSQFDKDDRAILLVDDELDQLPEELQTRGVLFVRGAPARDRTLTRCNIDHAAFAIILSKGGSDVSSDALNVAITLAVEARAPEVVTIVECRDASVEELLQKAGCDGIACTSRFDAHFLSQELLDPGAGDVIAQMTSNLSGQQVYITQLSAKLTDYQKVQKACQEKGHLSIGLRRDKAVSLNPALDHVIVRGDTVITIGPKRVALF